MSQKQKLPKAKMTCRWAIDWFMLLDSSLFLDSQFAAIVTTLWANCVREMPTSTIRAYNYCRNYCLVMRTTLCGTRV